MCTFLSIALSFIIYAYLINQAHSLQCLECQELPRPDDCRITTTCSGKSICFLQQVVTSGGVIMYNSGCASAVTCANKRSPTSRDIIKRQNPISNTDVVTCMDCCDDDFCNIEGCNILTSKPPQRPPICFTCQNQLNPTSCRDATLCDLDHGCALQQTELEWRSECVPSLQCRALEQLSMNNAAGPCYTCCHDDFCNNECTHHVGTSTSSLAHIYTTKYSTDVVTSTENPTTVLTHTKQSSTTTTTTTSATTTTATTKSTVAKINTKATTLQLSTSSQTSDKPITTKHTKMSTLNTQFSSISTTDKTPNSTSNLPSTHTMISTTKALLSTTSEAPASATSPWRTASTTSPLKQTSMSSTGLFPFSSSEITGKSTSFASTTQLHLASRGNIISNHTNASSSTSQPPTYTTDSAFVNATIEPYSTPQITILPQGCNNKKFDICFVVDSSGSLGIDGFEKEINFVKNIIRTISFNTTADAEFCVITFSTKSHTYIKLQHYTNVEDLIQAVGKIPYITGESYVHIGLHQAHTQFSHFARPGARNVTILLTDGHSTDSAKSLHIVNKFLRNVDKYTIGIGPQTNSSELAQITSGKNNLFEVPDISHLDGIQLNLIQSLCRSDGGQS